MIADPSIATSDQQEELFGGKVLEKIGKYDGDKVEVWPMSGHTIKVITYLSMSLDEHNPTLNTNCKYKDSDGMLIACRHLAYARLLNIKSGGKYPYRIDFKTQAGMLRDHSLKDNVFDKKNVTLYASSYHLLPRIDGNALGIGLAQACSTLKVGEEKKFGFDSGSHMTAIIVRLKEKDGLKYYSGSFYDPNHTVVDKRFVTSDLSQLELQQCLDEDRINFYFPKIKAGVLFCLSQEQRSSPPAVTVLPYSTTLSELAVTLPYRLQYNIDPEQISGIIKEVLESKEIIFSNKKEFLVANLQNQGYPGLYLALQNGHYEAVAAYVEAILKSDLPAVDKKELLAAKNADGIPALFIALERGHPEAVTAYVQAVLSSNLTDEDKIELLAAKQTDGCPGLYVALQQGKSEAVIAYVNAILSSSLLTDKHKIELLAAKRTDGCSGLGAALQQGHYQLVETYMKIILLSDLSPGGRKELLAAKEGEKSIWSLLIQYDLNTHNYNRINKYLDLILKSNVIDIDDTFGIAIDVIKATVEKCFSPVTWLTVALMGWSFLSSSTLFFECQDTRLAREMLNHARDKMRNPDKSADEDPKIYLTNKKHHESSGISALTRLASHIRSFIPDFEPASITASASAAPDLCDPEL